MKEMNRSYVYTPCFHFRAYEIARTVLRTSKIITGQRRVLSLDFAKFDPWYHALSSHIKTLIKRTTKYLKPKHSLNGANLQLLLECSLVSLQFQQVLLQSLCRVLV